MAAVKEGLGLLRTSVLGRQGMARDKQVHRGGREELEEKASTDAAEPRPALLRNFQG